MGFLAILKKQALDQHSDQLSDGALCEYCFIYSSRRRNGPEYSGQRIRGARSKYRRIRIGFLPSYMGTLLVLRMEFRLYSGSYQLRLRQLDDGGSWRSTSWFSITDAPHAIEFDWRAAGTAGANDGGVTFWIDGAQKASLSTVDNDTRRIDLVRLGAVAGVDSTTGGSYYLDAFEARRQTYIGP